MNLPTEGVAMNVTEKLKQKWREDPMLCLVVGGFVLTAGAKFIDAWSAAKGRQAYAQQVDYRINTRK